MNCCERCDPLEDLSYFPAREKKFTERSLLFQLDEVQEKFRALQENLEKAQDIIDEASLKDVEVMVYDFLSWEVTEIRFVEGESGFGRGSRFNLLSSSRRQRTPPPPPPRRKARYSYSI